MNIMQQFLQSLRGKRQDPVKGEDLIFFAQEIIRIDKELESLPSPVSSGVQTVTDDGNTVVAVDNTNPANPVIGFNGVHVDGVTVTGDGTTGSPLQAAATGGTVTSVGLVTEDSGTDIAVSGSPVTTSGTITLRIPTASASATGKLSATDWSTFNSKQNALGYTPENAANKETTALDTSTTKYPCNNVVKTAVDAKQNTITTGTTAQYFKGDLSLGTFNTDSRTSIGSYIFAKDISNNSHTGNTNNTLLKSCLIPANTLSSGKVLRIIVYNQATGTAGTKTIRVYFNTSAAIGGASIIALAQMAAGGLSLDIWRDGLISTGSYLGIVTGSSQVTSFANLTAAKVATSVNWTVDQYLVIAGQLANSGDTVTCNGYVIEII